MPKFRDLKDSEGLKNQLRFENDKTYILRLPEDNVEEWWEVWPTFPTGDGFVKRRFVSNSGQDSSNLKPVSTFKKDVGVPDGLDKRDQNNWKNTHRYATVVLVGTEVVVKKDGKKIRKIKWDAEAPKVWVFGREVFGQMKGINNNTDLIDRAEEKNLDMSELNCTDVYALRVTRTKKGSQAFEVDYDVQAGKLVGKIKEGVIDLDAINAELKSYIKPSTEAEIDDFLSENSGVGGGSSSGEEAESTEEVEADDDITIDEEPEEKPKKGKDKKKEDSDDDVDLSDIDDILEDD